MNRRLNPCEWTYEGKPKEAFRVGETDSDRYSGTCMVVHDESTNMVNVGGTAGSLILSLKL